MQKVIFLTLLCTAFVVCSLIQGAHGHGRHSSKERGSHGKAERKHSGKGIWGSDSKESVNPSENDIDEFFQRDSRCTRANSIRRGKSKCEASEKRKVELLEWKESGKSCTCYGHKWKRCTFEATAPTNGTIVAAPATTEEDALDFSRTTMPAGSTTDTYDDEDSSTVDGVSTTDDRGEDTATSIGIFTVLH